MRPGVPAGVAVGIQPTIDALLATVGGYLDQGYGRVKLKIEPGNDLARSPPCARRGPSSPSRSTPTGPTRSTTPRTWPSSTPSACSWSSSRWPSDDLLGHAALARRMATPLCLDESIVSVDTARTALHLGACSVVNLKPGRVGGYLEAVRIHDLCGEAGAGLWCGGMLETGIGRAANVALAALPELHAAGRPVGVVAVLLDRRHRAPRAGRRLPARARWAWHRRGRRAGGDRRSHGGSRRHHAPSLTTERRELLLSGARPRSLSRGDWQRRPGPSGASESERRSS